jgi:hypothetical protein
MSNVIRFLETLGREAGAGAPASAEFAAQVAALQIEPSLRQALVDGDVATLSRLLGGREKMMMVLAPADAPQNDEPVDEDAPNADIAAAA